MLRIYFPPGLRRIGRPGGRSFSDRHPTPCPGFLQKCQGLVFYPLLGPWNAEGLVLYPTSGLFLICCGKKPTVKPVVRFAGCPQDKKKEKGGRVRLRRVYFPPALGRIGGWSTQRALQSTQLGRPSATRYLDTLCCGITPPPKARRPEGVVFGLGKPDKIASGLLSPRARTSSTNSPFPPPAVKPSLAPSIPLFLPFFPPSLPCARRHRLPPSL